MHTKTGNANPAFVRTVSQVAHEHDDRPVDELLLQRIADGQPQALEQLYDRYAPAVMGLACKMMGDEASAEEIVQETFWRVWQNARSYRAGQGRCLSWLFGITRNLSIDTWRKRKVRPQVAFDLGTLLEMGHEPADPDSNVSGEAWLQIKAQQVKQALGTLPASQREVIEMSFFWGLTRQEIAEATGTPLGTVHTRARLGLEKLRSELMAVGIDD